MWSPCVQLSLTFHLFMFPSVDHFIQVKDAVLYSGFRRRSCVDKVKGDRFHVVSAVWGCFVGRLLALRWCLSVWLHLVLFFDEY